MTARTARSALTLVALALFAAPLAAQPLPVEKLEGMKARAIGPAGMSGRVTAIDVVHANPAASNIVTTTGSFSTVAPGMFVTSPNDRIPYGTKVISKTNSTTLVLSSVATSSRY